MMIRVCVTMSLILLLGCSKEPDFEPEYNVPDNIQPIVSRFLQEAAQRGFSYEISNLIVRYDAELPAPFCGQCNSSDLNPRIQKIISINQNLQCWFSAEEFEALIFHELGHCFLGRLHDNSLLPNGDPKSLMMESNFSVYSPCIYPIGDEPCNFLFKRPYYLDELFDQGTPVPEWGE